jgi:Putative peptidoglycan binding domain
VNALPNLVPVVSRRLILVYLYQDGGEIHNKRQMKQNLLALILGVSILGWIAPLPSYAGNNRQGKQLEQLVQKVALKKEISINTQLGIDISPRLQPPGVRCPMPLLHRNDHQKRPNEAVKILQRRLREYNIPVKVDGFFGRKTEDGVIEYQQRGNDHDPDMIVDGIVGKNTWKSLLICS